MSESTNVKYPQVEVIKPPQTTAEAVGTLLGALAQLAFITLAVWWFFAAWFPELGLTYWQLVLPVWAFRVLTARRSDVRQLRASS